MTLRTVARVAITAGIVAVSAVAAVAPAHAATEELKGKKYVALGDSFASGYGLPPYAATPSPACAQSDDNVAHRIARTYGLDLVDVSCAGATISNVVDTPQSVPGGTVPAQLDALTADTAVVSLMIGGNDVGFTELAGCLADSPQGPLLSQAGPDCKSGLGDLPLLIQTAIAPAYDALFAAIKQKAPNAEIILLGYPALAPTDENTPATGCFSSAFGTPLPTDAYPFTDVDRGFFAQVSAALDAAQKAAAERNNARFVSNLAASDTHTPCAGNAESYLNGVTLTSISPLAGADGALHPNAAGVAFLEAQLAAALDAAFPAAPPAGNGGGGAAVPAPTTPAGTTTSAHNPTTELAATGAELVPLAAAGALILALGVALTVARRSRAGDMRG
jgi:lysophospholipase L1-like esterase